MAKFPALSIVAPGGSRIRSGEKTLEIREWAPEKLPLLNLVIVQNKIRLSSDGITEDPEGEAVALVEVVSVDPWKESDLETSCGKFWEPGWLAWRLENVRALRFDCHFPARLRIYSIEMPETLPA